MLHIITTFPDGSVKEEKYKNISMDTQDVENFLHSQCPIWAHVEYRRKNPHRNGRGVDCFPADIQVQESSPVLSYS